MFSLNERKDMGKNHRPDRLAGEIRKKVGELLINGVKDPRITDNFVNVTGVEVTKDGTYATIYLSCLDFSEDEEFIEQQKEAVLAGVNSAKGMFRTEIAKAIKMRHAPELIFKIDEAEEYAQKIEKILSTIPFDEYRATDSNEVEE